MAAKKKQIAVNEEVIDASEEAVRLYLRYLEDPKSLVDHERVAVLEREARWELDLIARLRILGEVVRLSEPDRASLEQNFAEHAKSWVEKNDVPWRAFTAAGVSDDLLRRAGFPVSKKPSVQSRPRRTRSLDLRSRVLSWVDDQTVPFMTRDLVIAMGCSPASGAQLIRKLSEEGILESVGTDPAYRGAGRSPMLYRKKRGAA